MPFSCSRKAAPEALTGCVPQQTAADSQALVFHLSCSPQTGCSVANSNSRIATSRQCHPSSVIVLQASHGSSKAAATDDCKGSATASSPHQQQQMPSPASTDALFTSGLVPALYLGDVFITANTVAGIINSSATAAAEGRMPTARHSRTHRTAQQQHQQHIDPSSALLLKLMQPLPQPFPTVDGSSSQQQQQQRMLFYVQKECAEFVRQELLLHRYNEVVAARAAAGLPTTAAEPNSSNSSTAAGHRKTMLEHIQAAVTGSSSSSSSRTDGAHETADSQSAHQASVRQQQQQQQHVLMSGVGKVMQDLHAKVINLVPGWQQQQQQCGSSAVGGSVTDGSAATPGPDAAATSSTAVSRPSSSDVTGGNTSSSSSSGMVGARRSLPAVLAAQLSSFMSDLHTLEEEAVLREGQQITAQRKQTNKTRGRNNSSRHQHWGSRDKQAAADGSSSDASSGHAAFNFASYVARIPLAAAMQLLRPHTTDQQQQQPQQDSSKVSIAGPSSSSSSSSSSGYDLAISGGDLRACLAVQNRDAFVDLDDVSPAHHDHHHSSTWQLGVYEPSSDEDLDQDNQRNDDQQHQDQISDDHHDLSGSRRQPRGDRYITNNQKKIAAAAAITSGGDGAADSRNTQPAAAPADLSDNNSSNRSRGGRFRWGHQEQQSPDIPNRARQQQQQHMKGKDPDGHHHHSSPSATYTPLILSSDLHHDHHGAVDLRDLEQQQQQLHDYGEVRVPLSQADIGICDRTPVFQVPGLHITLDTSHGEVSFSPAFLSLAHLVALMHTAKTAATKIWISNRRTNRRDWRHSVEVAAAALAAGGSSSSSRYGSGSGGYGGSSRSAAAADDESDEDDDGMGDPPEAKALLEELGESQPRAHSSRGGSAGDRGSGGSVVIPNRQGLSGVLTTMALGTISLAAAGCCAVQELVDLTAVAVPAVGEWVIGFPNSVNIKAAFLEDLAAAAAVYNTGRLKPPKETQSASAAAAASASAGAVAAAAASKVGELYDPLGLVTKGDPTKQQQQQQHHDVPPSSSSVHPSPPVTLPSVDGLRMLLSAGWAVLRDVLVSDGSMAGHIISSVAASSGGGRRRGLGTLQVTEEGEIALRLGLAVKAAPVMTTAAAAAMRQQQQQRSSSVSKAHVFDVGVHVNLSHLIGVPSMQQDDQLAAARGGVGAAAQGILLIGDLALDPDEMTETMWRGPQVGFGLLPVKPLMVAQGVGEGGSNSSSKYGK